MTAHIRPTHVQIDLAALRHNRRVLGKAARHKQLCAVVKANAYGHGAIAVAQALAACGIHIFGVALMEEALALRQAGIHHPIVVWGGSLDWPTCVRHKLSPVLERVQDLQELAACAASEGQTVSCHLEVDTGMARLGLQPADVGRFLVALREATNVRLDGIMTHLALADIVGHSFTQQQRRLFAAALQTCRLHGVEPPLVHFENSPALFSVDDRHTTMARCGLALYGLQPLVGQVVPNLRPVLQFCTRIVSLRQVRSGQTVSYGGRFTAKSDLTVATLPVGYADGYRRSFSNRAQVLVRGQLAPVVGTVCMDLCMVDVSHIDGARLGDEVVLLGQQGDARLDAETLATWGETISYEIVCGIGSRVPRVYVQQPVATPAQGEL